MPCSSATAVAVRSSDRNSTKANFPSPTISTLTTAGPREWSKPVGKGGRGGVVFWGGMSQSAKKKYDQTKCKSTTQKKYTSLRRDMTVPRPLTTPLIFKGKSCLNRKDEMCNGYGLERLLK
ncbi:hypothetical protein T492DRAFT_1032398, partial [Pavlovales sp. CCMP2436]